MFFRKKKFLASYPKINCKVLKWNSDHCQLIFDYIFNGHVVDKTFKKETIDKIKYLHNLNYVDQWKITGCSIYSDEYISVLKHIENFSNVKFPVWEICKDIFKGISSRWELLSEEYDDKSLKLNYELCDRSSGVIYTVGDQFCVGGESEINPFTTTETNILNMVMWNYISNLKKYGDDVGEKISRDKLNKLYLKGD
jgi:hypothetical protein